MFGRLAFQKNAKKLTIGKFSCSAKIAECGMGVKIWFKVK